MTDIVLEHLTIGYGKKVIAADLNLALPNQAVTCLLGGNGCGKTTLLKTILGTLPAIDGAVLINQKPITTYSHAALSRLMAYVPQAHHHVFPFTVEEVVLMGRTAHISWHATPKAADLAIAHEYLERLNLSHLRTQAYTELSGGQRQLVLIARALAQKPAILIMDEPTASLDFGNQLKVLNHIETLKAEGMSILLTTHQPEHAAHISDHVVLFHQGKIIQAGTPQDCLTASHLATLYDLPMDTIHKHLNHMF
ncbi:iron ABC transporter ATP-binding protein [Wohlfahrtiimonas chitiniclastica]|uniref:ABC transporter ATP-binding protein n=1 Tax=Wohlfahrtiimonas chitiniclastica TaxID=400946 RepID=UPI000B97F68B|nr:ABC transporter ATP-binding protein [Wohlfahrtiimonas chitiniclastica]OYQ89563.1 iron ABC transporter ATP-binding protein [Wohlfahrtiimonas chitiniclastica]